MSADPEGMTKAEYLARNMERAGLDHTSGVMRCRYEVIGGHVHCAIFGPFSGKAGDLTFRVSEWDHFRKTHPNWQFAPVDEAVARSAHAKGAWK